MTDENLYEEEFSEDVIWVEKDYKTDSLDEYSVDKTGDIQKVEQPQLSVFDQIKSIAKVTKFDIQDPNPDCVHCKGEGYTGYDDNKTPIACACIFPANSLREQLGAGDVRGLNRKRRRALEKQNRKSSKSSRLKG